MLCAGSALSFVASSRLCHDGQRPLQIQVPISLWLSSDHPAEVLLVDKAYGLMGTAGGILAVI